MQASDQTASLEQQIDQWRSYLRRRQAIKSVDIAELEDHLREQIDVLTSAGLASDEAFLVAVKRMGGLDALSREFAREHSDRLWKQLVMAPAGAGEPQGEAQRDAMVAFGLTALVVLLIKTPAIFGVEFHNNVSFYFRNFSLFVLPPLTGYFAWKRQLSMRTLPWLAAAFVLAIVVAVAYPHKQGGDMEGLTALHLPIALWLVVLVAYAGRRWNEVPGRMDFIRFSGELSIYYTLIALGGVVLIGFTTMIFQSAGLNVDVLVQNWLIPCGAAGGVIVAAWLVEAKQSVVENMAPVLARLFTPLFTIALIVFLGTLVFTGRGVNIDRNLLIAFNVLLVLVLGLLLYSVSARDPQAQPGIYDGLQLALLISALAADAVALSAIATRISEFGFTPNRVAALGENLVLLVNLAWAAVLYIQFLRKRGSFAAIEKWQTNYLPVYAGWAAIVVIVFPPVFGFR